MELRTRRIVERVVAECRHHATAEGDQWCQRKSTVIWHGLMQLDLILHPCFLGVYHFQGGVFIERHELAPSGYALTKKTFSLLDLTQSHPP